jgi:anti-anti-sigma factor
MSVLLASTNSEPRRDVLSREVQVEVKRDTAHGTVVYRISGELNASTGPNLESALAIKEGSSRVILDMRRVTYVSSAGLRVIIQAAKQAKNSFGGVAIFGLQPLVMEVFDACGLGTIIPIASDETEARSRFAV